MHWFKLAFAFVTFAISSLLYSKGTAINTTGTAADASAILDVSSTTQGVLFPRMTLSQRTAISSPATGLTVYQTDGTVGLYYNSGTPASPVWALLNSAATSGSNVGGLQVFDASSGTTLNYTVTDATVRFVFFDCKGRSASGVTITVTLPAAGSYPYGTVIAVALTNYATTAASAINLISPGSTLNALNNNNTSTATAVYMGNNAGSRLMSDGVSKWYRLLN